MTLLSTSCSILFSRSSSFPHYKVVVLGEDFNLFNHTNFTSVLTNAVNYTKVATGKCLAPHTNDCLVPRTDFLVPSASGNSIYGARQLQVSIKLLF